MSTELYDRRLLDLMKTVLIKTLLIGNFSLDAHANTQILDATIGKYLNY